MNIGICDGAVKNGISACDVSSLGLGSTEGNSGIIEDSPIPLGITFYTSIFFR